LERARESANERFLRLVELLLCHRNFAAYSTKLFEERADRFLRDRCLNTRTRSERTGTETLVERRACAVSVPLSCAKIEIHPRDESSAKHLVQHESRE